MTGSEVAYTASLHCRPNIQREHNLRIPSVVAAEEHIDADKFHETILDTGTLQESFEMIFGNSRKEYNKGRRKDRCIHDYLCKIMNDNRKGQHKNPMIDGNRKPAYEMIIQLGNREHCPDRESAKEILRDFSLSIQKKYPNIIPIGIYLHDDEFSLDNVTKEKIYSPPHIHYDFVYVAHKGKSIKTGMRLQCSMTGALKEMGFETCKKKRTAQIQFEEDCRHWLQDFAEKKGIPIDRTPGKKHSHLEKEVYQQMKENERTIVEIREKSKIIKYEEGKIETEKELLNEYCNQLEEQKTSINSDRIEINQKSEKADSELKEAKCLKEKAGKELQVLENKKTFIQNCKKVQNEVKNSRLKIKNVIENFRNDNLNPEKAIAKFIEGVNKIVTAISYELAVYKQAFSEFWKRTPNDMRLLAKRMEDNGCRTFEEYNNKKQNGKLLSQKTENKKTIENIETCKPEKNGLGMDM